MTERPWKDPPQDDSHHDATTSNEQGVSWIVPIDASELSLDAFANQVLSIGERLIESQSHLDDSTAYRVLSTVIHNKLLGLTALHGLVPIERRRALLEIMQAGATVEVSLSRKSESQVWLETKLTPDRSGRIEICVTPSLPQLRAEWEIALAALDEKSPEFEQARSEGNLDFVGQLMAELPKGVVLEVPEGGLSKDSNQVNVWVELELAQRNQPLSGDGHYDLRLTNCFGLGDCLVLVSYFPHSEPDALQDWIEWVTSNVRGAFRKKLKAKVVRPRAKVFPVGLDTILDANLWSELPQEDADIQGRTREAIGQYGTEALGWYQPYHEYDQEHWGIYLHGRRLFDLGLILSRRLSAVDCPNPNLAFEIVNQLVLHHELFHAQLETFGLSQEMTRSRPAYLKYGKSVYRRTAGTSNHLEEAIANYVGYEFVRKMVNAWVTHRNWKQNHVDVVVQFIEEQFDISPAGYRDWRLGAKSETWRLLATQVLTADMAPANPLPPLEPLLRTLPNGVLRLSDIPIWITDDVGFADRLFGTPCRRDAARLLESRGFYAEAGGKHPVYIGPNGSKFPLPTRDPLSQTVFHSLLRTMGISKQEYMAMRRHI